MTMEQVKEIIESGNAVLGIELGSTRIKASLISRDSTPLASGSYGWENRLVDGIWTYSLDDVWEGLAACYADLAKNVNKEYGVSLKKFSAVGISAMMHGYISIDKEGKLLTPFRTWRNNITGEACEKLSPLFNFAIPQRWSIAHLYQAVLNGEEHVGNIAYLTTLAGYVHWKLTGRKVLGIGDASGMFPIDPAARNYDDKMINAFDGLVQDRGFPWRLSEILPEVLVAGNNAGTLTAEGAKLIDPSGSLREGIPFCPPEGDAGTGMVATNSVRPRTGNVSAGTSVFAMLVLEKPLSKPHEEIDIVVTPDGKPVGMAHSNNCSSDFDAWMGVFARAVRALGVEPADNDLYGRLMPLALQGDTDCGGMLAVSYVSGEHITGFTEGRPLLVRQPDKPFTLENLLRSLLFTSFCALRTGLNILTLDEGVEVDEIRGHGGIFKTAGVAQKIMAAATNIPVSLPETAGEGGSWGMALLAAFMVREDREQALPDFLDTLIAGSIGTAVKPDPKDVAGFDEFFQRYHAGLSIEREAVKVLR
jgi:sugar (pentulose or hexulose) kinase